MAGLATLDGLRLARTLTECGKERFAMKRIIVMSMVFIMTLLSLGGCYIGFGDWDHDRDGGYYHDGGHDRYGGHEHNEGHEDRR